MVVDEFVGSVCGSIVEQDDARPQGRGIRLSPSKAKLELAGLGLARGRLVCVCGADPARGSSGLSQGQIHLRVLGLDSQHVLCSAHDAAAQGHDAVSISCAGVAYGSGAVRPVSVVVVSIRPVILEVV